MIDLLYIESLVVYGLVPEIGETMVVTSDMVGTYGQKIAFFRRCFFERSHGLTLASRELPPLVEHLRAFVTQGSDQSKSVLGQALHLSSLLSCHRMDYGACLRELTEMIKYARDIGDVDMEAAALIRQGMLYYYEFRPCQRHAVFRRAMQLLNKVESPLIHVRVLYGYAESIAASGQVELAGVQRYAEAERYLERAESVQIADDDPGHVYVRHSHVTRAIHRARFLVAHRQCREAAELLVDVYSREAVPENVEVLSILAEAHSHMIIRQEADGSFERMCFFTEALVDSAQRMGSVLYHSQAQIYYEFLMLSKWYREFSERLLPVVSFSI